jgi:outer membrane protein TolC
VLFESTRTFKASNLRVLTVVMQKYLVVPGAVLGAAFLMSIAFGQDQSINPTPQPSPVFTPGATLTPPTPTLVSTVTPTPAPISTPTPTLTPNESGTLGVPLALATPVPVPSPTPPTSVRAAVLGASDLGWSEKGAPTFTIEKAVITALQQNPDILRALQEIERTKGVVIEIRAQALPHIGPSAVYDWTDPNLNSNFSSASGGGSSSGFVQSDVSYNIKVTGTQLIFNGTTFPAIRGTFFQRDSAYFALRNTVDQVISTVKTQFYQVVVNRELIVVQQEAVHLLESQLKDQQNRFEAGTVPRFNVLQAEVALYNQIPQLIAARNTYRISILQLAKTLGLDFNPARGIAAPLRAVGQLTYVPRKIALLEAIELGKQNRPFLKQARANVLNQTEQVHVAIGGFFPTISATGGGEWLSSPISSSWHDVSKGWIAGVTGSWPIWDSGQVYGQVKQQRALLFETKITYDDDVRQVELEIQQAVSNLQQNRELIQATEKNVEQANEAVRLAKARFDAGAGTQLDVLNAQVQLTTAESTRLQALFGYITSLAEYDRVTGAQSSYTEKFDGITPRAARSKTYYTGSDVDASGKPKPTPLPLNGLTAPPPTLR